jgi:hypothetical protein
MPKNGVTKGDWGAVNLMRIAESEAVGGFTAKGGVGFQQPNTSQTAYVSVKQVHNPDRASVNGATTPASSSRSGRRVKGQ